MLPTTPAGWAAAGSVLSGVGSAVGGLLGFKSAKKQNKEAKRQFNIQMNESIQRRVADAQKAGIHPLFALGGSVGASPTITGQANTGSHLGDALSGLGESAKGYAAWRSAARQAEKLNAAEVNAKNQQAARDAAEAALLDSQRARLTQQFNAQGHDGFRAFPYGTYPDASARLMFGPVESKAPIQSTTRPGDPSTRSGQPATWVESYAGGGYTLRSIDQDVHQADMVNDAYLASQLWTQFWDRRQDKREGIYKLQLPDGRWRRFKLIRKGKAKPRAKTGNTRYDSSVNRGVFKERF